MLSFSSHYLVIALPMEDNEKAWSEPHKPAVPLGKLVSLALSEPLATRVEEHVPFVVGDYLAGELPPKLRIRGKWVREAFKPDTYYSFVIAAFTEPKV